MGQLYCSVCLFILALFFLDGATAKDVDLTAETVSFGTNVASGIKPALLRGELRVPESGSKPHAAMVILSSSGGVIDWIEGYYARELFKQGIPRS